MKLNSLIQFMELIPVLRLLCNVKISNENLSKLQENLVKILMPAEPEKKCLMKL